MDAWADSAPQERPRDTAEGRSLPTSAVVDLAAARAALARADWEEAWRLLTGGETAKELEALGRAAWWLDDSATAMSVRERAFHGYREAGDPRGAARVALALANDHLYFRGEPAVARGWLGRAERLLADLEPCPEQGWLALGAGDYALSFAHNSRTARRHAAEAAAIGRRLGVLDLEMMALALEGLALVCEGRLEEGMPRLDEAAAAAVAGELEDFYAIGFAYCCLVQACERVRDFARAAQWCERAREFGERVRFGLLNAVCRTQYASVLIWRGAWQQAESELNIALEQLRSTRPPLQGEALVRLARLRRLQGRGDEAAALLEEAAEHPLTLVERAELALTQGDATSAAHLAERFLRQIDPADLTWRIHGLDALLRARSARGDCEQEAALAELRRLAAAFGTDPMRAAVRLTEGRLAAAGGDWRVARAACEDAVDLYRRSGAALETAAARLELAEVLLAAGGREEARGELDAACATLAELGSAAETARVERLRAALERTSPVCGAARALTRREVEVLRLVARGMSNAAIAAELDLSDWTIKRHVANILGKLDLPTRAAAAAWAARSELL